MNVKKWLLASVAVLVVIKVVGFVFHQVLFTEIYKQTAAVWRPEAQIMSMMWLMLVGCVIFSLMFVFIYARGYESRKSGIGQGLRYGLYVFLLVHLAMSFSWYVVLPIPATLSVYWLMAGLVESLLAGVTVGLIYKP